MAATLCLCMIVRNESRVIARALRSVYDHIDYWVICDTGSTDTTALEILNTLVGIPGELHSVPWVDFGYNRTDVLRRAGGKADYFLILDADMVANVHAPFKHLLTADYYELRYTGDVDYRQRMLVSGRHQWQYEGVTHEYIYSPTAFVEGDLPQLTLTHLGDGGMRFDKFERDEVLLRGALERDPENARSTFYLAQTYKDLGRPADALPLYEKRATLAGWDEETWYALYQAARMRQALGQPWPDVRDAFLRAYNARPARLEPLYEIVRTCREREQWAEGYLFAAQVGQGVRYPDDKLFVEKAVYDHLLLLEYGVCAFGCGRAAEAVEAFNLLLRNENTPGWVAESARRGLAMAVDALYPHRPHPERRENDLVVIVPFHNAGPYLEPCIASLLEQDYPNVRVLMMDDGSTDGASRFVPNDDRFVLFRNETRRGLAPNLHFLLREHCQAEDIVVCVDGDDRLACADALTHVNNCYNEYGCWVLYGQFQFADGTYGFSQPFASLRDFASLRLYYRTSHLRTFRAGLFHRIADQDPEYDCLRDEQGEWLQSSVDAALMAPIVEMAGYDRVRYNHRTLYIYNADNPLSVHHRDRAGQLANFALIHRKRPFARIDDYLVSSSTASREERCPSMQTS